DEQARVYAGLRAVTEQLFGREWPRDQASGAGGHLRLERGLVDSGWNTELVKRFCRQSPFAALLVPSKGFGITATAAPMSAWGRKQGQRWFNAHCMVNHDRLCNFDSNYHKSQVANRLLTPPGGLGCVYLPSGDHAHFVEHLASEYRVTATADRQGRKVDEWKLKPGGPDNHWWDSLILSAVAATTLGVRYKAQAAAAAGAVPAASPGPSGDSGSARRVPAAPVGGSGGAGQRKAQGKGRRTLGEMMREKRAEAQGAYPWMSR
ncbi:MAG TPA: terminase gpA endonuclease subunit, partial [Urbifossiella sp.]|nr:terminase gpA endonuclease subunit [Urbifossiella sp.]